MRGSASPSTVATLGIPVPLIQSSFREDRPGEMRAHRAAVLLANATRQGVGEAGVVGGGIQDRAVCRESMALRPAQGICPSPAPGAPQLGLADDSKRDYIFFFGQRFSHFGHKRRFLARPPVFLASFDVQFSE
jgi:hypothetical protein